MVAQVQVIQLEPQINDLMCWSTSVEQRIRGLREESEAAPGRFDRPETAFEQTLERCLQAVSTAAAADATAAENKVFQLRGSIDQLEQQLENVTARC